jgi:hypothetical protein
MWWKRNKLCGTVFLPDLQLGLALILCSALGPRTLEAEESWQRSCGSNEFSNGGKQPNRGSQQEQRGKGLLCTRHMLGMLSLNPDCMLCSRQHYSHFADGETEQELHSAVVRMIIIMAAMNV